MAANPLGAEIARAYGLEIASAVRVAPHPDLAAMALCRSSCTRSSGQVTATPEAPGPPAGLAELGPLAAREDRGRHVSRAWSGFGPRGDDRLDSTAVAFLASASWLATGVLTLGDIAKEGDVLGPSSGSPSSFTLTASSRARLMGYLGERLAGALGAWPRRWPRGPGRGLRALHYLCEPTAHLLALFGCSSDVASSRRPRGHPRVLLLFATNFFSANTPQGSSANLLSRERLSQQGQLYRLGALTTAFNLVLYSSSGSRGSCW